MTPQKRTKPEAPAVICSKMETSVLIGVISVVTNKMYSVSSKASILP